MFGEACTQKLFVNCELDRYCPLLPIKLCLKKNNHSIYILLTLSLDYILSYITLNLLVLALKYLITRPGVAGTLLYTAL